MINKNMNVMNVFKKILRNLCFNKNNQLLKRLEISKK